MSEQKLSRKVRKSSTTEAVLKDITVGAVHTTVDPAACVQLAPIPKTVKGGVIRLNMFFKSNGFQAGADNATVFEIRGTLQGELSCCFRFIGMADESIADQIRSQDTWYGIVHGEYT